MLNFIKPLPIVISLITTAGILMHEMHVDRATTLAVVPMAALVSAGAMDKVISQNYHTHVERVSISRSFRSSMPNIQPPRDDERKYIQNKKLLFVGGSDTTSLWPSV